MIVDSATHLSIVIPVLNEAESLPELVGRIREALKAEPYAWEVLFIDDGSTDDTGAVLARLHAEDPRVRAIRFRRNYGKSAALALAFQEARGERVVTMDGDLQDEPNEVPRMLARIEEGWDLVSGWKRVRNDPWTKTMPSKMFNAVTSLMSGIKLHDFNCGLKAYRSEVTQSLDVYGELHRYLPVLAHFDGFRVTELPVLLKYRFPFPVVKPYIAAGPSFRAFTNVEQALSTILAPGAKRARMIIVRRRSYT